MFKIKLSSVLIVVLLFFVVLLISGCSECSEAEDCPPAATCKTAVCDDGKCATTAVKDCCGNGIEDAKEDGKTGNKCTCPEDYGECKGKASMLVRNKKIDATYLEQGCEDDECVYKIDESRVKRTDLAFERELSYFTFDVLVTYNNPFTVNKDKVEVSLKLKDEKPDLVYPIEITAIRLIEGQTLFGGKDGLAGKFSQIGEVFSVQIPITYESALIEEERSATLKVDYEYKKRIRTTKNPDGTYNYIEELVRDSFESKLGKKIFFLFPGAVENEQ
ncbi:MAG TPA: hypothetical protein VJI46_04700 [Candidatus Nanoarchaeia archaeon]|nr:hypothetical protein [Candidatus Nanoarchaeia archaeon]